MLVGGGISRGVKLCEELWVELVEMGFGRWGSRVLQLGEAGV